MSLLDGASGPCDVLLSLPWSSWGELFSSL